MILSLRGCVHTCIYTDVNKLALIVIFKTLRVFDVCPPRFKVCYDCRGRRNMVNVFIYMKREDF